MRKPDYNRFLQVMQNQRPDCLVLYEHGIAVNVLSEASGQPFDKMIEQKAWGDFFNAYSRVLGEYGYDTLSWECGVCGLVPGNALSGGRQGPIQSRRDFELFQWEELAEQYWNNSQPVFEALQNSMVPGMKAVGGVGNGIFEISEALVGLEYLPFIEFDDPGLYAELYQKIGDLVTSLWSKFLSKYGNAYCACRMGDDLGFRTSLLTMPSTVRNHLIPQYKRIVSLCHDYGKPFILHSCGCIFEVMDDLIATGINAKHSNEDAIAPFEKWQQMYGDKIALLGGIDMDVICTSTPSEIKARVRKLAIESRNYPYGYALGTGNSIAGYVPAENYLAMIEAANEVRNPALSKNIDRAKFQARLVLA
jgi:uroporphyrinogen decarboxylase